MTIRTFWTIFIKILGIWLVLDSLKVLQFFSTVFSSNPGYPEDNNYLMIVYCLLTLGVYAIILWLFVFKTAWLIDKLHLDKGFTEDKLEFNIPHSTILTIAIIVIGGLIFADSLPPLCGQVFVFFQQKNVFKEDPSTSSIAIYLLKTIIGYLLMTNSKLLTGFINKQKTQD